MSHDNKVEDWRIFLKKAFAEINIKLKRDETKNLESW